YGSERAARAAGILRRLRGDAGHDRATLTDRAGRGTARGGGSPPPPSPGIHSRGGSAVPAPGVVLRGSGAAGAGEGGPRRVRRDRPRRIPAAPAPPPRRDGGA